MSAHHILGAVVGPKGMAVRRFKVVRELGLKRRETVWSLSAVGVGSLTGAAPRYERTGVDETSGVPVVTPVASPGS